jgi:pimeloyl-ACP methyl ester carboxylesterase
MATFVLIHGSWHGAWCWHKIVSRLQEAGHTVFAPDMPSHGKDWSDPKSVKLDDYVNRVIAEGLNPSREPAIVVAHSRGGIVASQVAEAAPERVRKLVYLAAFLLPDGARVLEYGRQDKESLVGPNLDVNPDEGWDMLRQEAFRETLYADCSADDYALCTSLLTPEPLAPTLTPLRLSAERYGRIPRFYIELEQDRAVTPTLQRKMYDEMPCQAVIRMPASHSAYFSMPDALAGHLHAIAS